MSFEKDLNDLEALVLSLEEGKLSLEESLLAYEKAIGLVRSCTQTLETAKQKVQVLSLRGDGTVVAQPFDGDET